MNHEAYMRRCLELAELGAGFVAPNPMVGAVIVHNQRIIGEGYHERFGESHAEVNAIHRVKDKSVLKNATIYVSLEPCSHIGKTPPCADLLIQHQFKKVVIACRDSFHQVDGKGIEKLKQAGIEVELGVLENEARQLNKRFFTFHELKRPYIMLKWAQTKDGFIDRDRAGSDTGINWISSPETQSLVHQWRSEEQAILVGKNTIINDNPSLTVRNVVGKNPLRIVLDKNLALTPDFQVFSDELPTLIFNSIKSEQINCNEFVQLENFSAQGIVNLLYERNIQSVLIEGGAKTLSSYIEAGLWDEARIIEGDVCFGKGLKAPTLSKLPSKTYSFSNDKIYHYFCR